MVSIKVVINSKLEIKYEGLIYKSMVQDSNSENLIISLPIINGKYLILKIGEEIDLNYYENKNIFNFKCKIINKIKENGVSYYSISLPYDIIKIQRRSYVRVDTVQKINYIKSYSEEVDNDENQRSYSALLLDLSGGGMRIKLKDKLSKEDIIIAKIGSESGELVIKGKVVRVYKTEDRNYIYGISFYEIDNNVREKIIETVFKIMRKQRELI